MAEITDLGHYVQLPFRMVLLPPTSSPTFPKEGRKRNKTSNYLSPGRWTQASANQSPHLPFPPSSVPVDGEKQEEKPGGLSQVWGKFI